MAQKMDILNGTKTTGSKTADKVMNFSLEKLFEKSMGPAKKYAIRDVKKIRAAHPNAPREEILARLEKKYLNVVTGSGGAAGGASALPGVGLATGFTATMADMGFFLVATMTYVYGVLEVCGEDLADADRERALLLTIFSGGSTSPGFKKASQKIGGNWAAKVLGAGRNGDVSLFNRILGRQILSKLTARSGAMLAGKILPFGIGAFAGGAMNRALGAAMVAATRATFKDLNAARE